MTCPGGVVGGRRNEHAVEERFLAMLEGRSEEEWEGRTPPPPHSNFQEVIALSARLII